MTRRTSASRRLHRARAQTSEAPARARTPPRRPLLAAMEALLGRGGGLALAVLVALGPSTAGAPPAAGGTIPVRGVVVDEAGEPLAGARVELLPDRTPFEHSLLLLEGTDEPEPAAALRTGADGAFELLAPEPGFWEVRASAPDRLPVVERLSPLLAPRDLAPLTAPRGPRISVRVLDERGEPVQGALVAALAERWLGGEEVRPAWWRDRITFVHTGRDGRAAVSGSDNGATHVEALAPGHALAAGKTAGDSLELRLAPGAERPVRVLQADGSAAAGAVVLLGRLGLPAVRTSEDGGALVRVEGKAPLVLQARSAEGDWTHGVLRPAAEAPAAAAETVPADGAAAGADPGGASAPGAADSDAAAPGAAGTAAGTAADAGPAAAIVPPAPLELRCPPVRWLDVQVIDATTRRPVPGAVVWAPVFEFPVVATGPGRYRVRLTEPPGTSPGRGAPLVTEAVGYLRGVDEVPAAPRTAGDEAGGSAPEALTIELRPARQQRGRVFDGAGEPVAGAEISAWPLGYQGDDLRQVARTDADGTFALSGLAPETRYTVVAERRGFARLRTLIAVPSEGEAEPLDLVLSPGIEAAGLVLDATGQPVPGAVITLAPAPDGRASFSVTSSSDRGPRGPHAATADAAGRFHLAGLAAGRYDLEARAEGFAPLRVPGIDVEPPPGAVGEPADLGTLHLERGSVVTGRVVDAAGEPLAGASVSLGVVGRDDGAYARSDEQGRFSFPGQPSRGATVLGVYLRGYTPLRLPLDLPVDAEVEVVMHPAAGISGIVVGPDGEPLEGVRVRISEDRGVGGGSSHGTISAEGGRFESHVEPGTVRVAAFAEGLSSGTPLVIELAPGQRRDDLRLELTAGGTVQGRVTGRGGRPVAGAWIEYGDDMGGQAMTDLEGNYRLGGMSPGPQRLRIIHREYPATVRELEVGPGNQTLDIRLDPGAEIHVRAVDEAGEPVAGAQVALGRGGSSSHGGRDLTAADGRYVQRGLEPGRYWVQLTRAGYRTATSEEVELEAGGEVEIELVMGRGAVVTGRLLGIDPAQLGDLRVTMFGGAAGRAGPGTVSHDGTYRVEGVGPGEWTLMVDRPEGWATRKQEVTVGESEARMVADVDFGGGVTVTGVVGRGESIWRDANITVNCPNSDGQAESGPDGRFVIRGLTPGRCTVRVVSRSGTRIRQVVDLAADADADAEIEIHVPPGPPPTKPPPAAPPARP